MGGRPLADTNKPLLIKRYASRRLYNTETSDYVTLEDIAEFIRDGREVQIIAEHESRGEHVLPINVLTDLVRSYTTQATSLVPDFLQASFEMLRDGQSQMMENMTKANPLAGMPGMEAMRAQQEAFVKAMTGGMPGIQTGPAKDQGESARSETTEDLDEIKKQLADLQQKLSRMDK
jgi:polyhydroxyalkanoate synthesis regulator protein